MNISSANIQPHLNKENLMHEKSWTILFTW